MNLYVHVLGKRVATLESIGDFKSVLTYDSDVAAGGFVSLTMSSHGAAFGRNRPPQGSSYGHRAAPPIHPKVYLIRGTSRRYDNK